MAQRIVLVGGGARSGKSRFAQGLAEGRGQKRAFIATAQAFDDEMEQRIALHRQERAGRFRTLESSVALAQTLDQNQDCDVVLIDCLTLYLSNLLLLEPDAPSLATEARIDEELHGTLQAIDRHPGQVIIVTNEVGMGIVPVSPLGRIFRDVAGRAHQLIAARADELYFAAMGVILRLRPDPISTLTATTT